jgi:hypothetical protein
MQALIFFGMIEESIMLHGPIAKLMKSQKEAKCILSIE